LQQHGKYNSLKLRALSAFENRGWLSPRTWAALAKFNPVRAAYSYLRRLYIWKLLDRAVDECGLLLYRMNSRGSERLNWLRSNAAVP
jgi:hypothetical protein